MIAQQISAFKEAVTIRYNTVQEDMLFAMLREDAWNFL